MVALSIIHYMIYGWVGGDIIINSYIHLYCMSDSQQSQFKKLKSYVISGRSEQSEDIQ